MVVIVRQPTQSNAKYGCNIWAVPTLIQRYTTRYRARALSKQGEHARALAALALNKNTDIRVLSQSGMHLSVLKHTNIPSVEVALALTSLNRLDQAFAVIAQIDLNSKASTVLGKLATLAPDRVLTLLKSKAGFDNIKAYCSHASDNFAPRAWKYERISEVHKLTLQLKSSSVDDAARSFGNFFRQHRLLPPDAKFSSTGFSFTSLTCSSSRVVTSALPPVVSVVMTTRNEEKTVKHALTSLLGQSWEALEILVVDDGSTDNTAAIVRDLSLSDKRVTLLQLPKNLGLWKAKNIGLKHCSGDFVTMHDADDWSHPRKIELQLEPMLTNDSIKATSSYMLRIAEATGTPFTRNACNYLRWNPSSFMFRRGILKDVGYYDENLLGSDCEFVARIETRLNAARHRRIRKPLAIGLQRNDSLSDRFRYGDSIIKRLEHWELWRSEHLNWVHSHPHGQT